MAKHILFDLDGTLTDSGLGIIRSIEYALNKVGYKLPADFEMRKFVGPPLSVSYSEFCGFEGEKLEDAIKFYRERYSTIGLFENELYPGIITLLAKLNKDGYKCYVATSKPEKFAKQIIEHFKLTEFFEIVAGSMLNGNRQDKHEVIEYVLSNIPEEDKDRIVMIGDTKFDVEGAKRVGLDTLAVTYGYGSRKELAVAGAYKIAADTEVLYNLICEYFKFL